MSAVHRWITNMGKRKSRKQVARDAAIITTRLRYCRRFVEIINELCTCGGGGPKDGCAACKVYHAIADWEVMGDGGEPSAQKDSADVSNVPRATTL